jgi:hypothetical protein
MPARLFDLVREQDVTGISGTGVVAEGVEFSDGTVVMRWLPVDGVLPTTVVHAGVDNVLALHGHNGMSKVVWRE